jgi:hypothetical protein
LRISPRGPLHLRRVRAGRDRIPVGSGEVFNLGDEPSYSVGLWARMILDAAGSSAELVRVPDQRLPAALEETVAPGQPAAGRRPELR